MNILLAFSPFIAFAVIERLIGPIEGLIAGAAVAAILIFREWSAKRSPKILEIGTFLLFAALALYALIFGLDWPLFGVRLAVDFGLFLIVLISMIIRKPFTVQYAKEEVPSTVWNHPEFLRKNMVITAVWALAFAVMVVADYILLTRPDISRRVGIIATIAALVGAFKFTNWYPSRN
ncbi:hypothetical protein [Mesorhizobium denitrificans]|uniref:Intracellular septation protein A n=1 Tax=Mesorhizobium denitrificans TaxID=2294114 RepID=A0A371XF32_9HYPH|nr:hypothetical protein [Mesorhizobium denitrificans]RFC67841.1 hypothetical protein DY251_09665 [Mesorhizobium denitrificans]